MWFFFNSLIYRYHHATPLLISFFHAIHRDWSFLLNHYFAPFSSCLLSVLVNCNRTKYWKPLVFEKSPFFKFFGKLGRMLVLITSTRFILFIILLYFKLIVTGPNSEARTLYHFKMNKNWTKLYRYRLLGDNTLFLFVSFRPSFVNFTIVLDKLALLAAFVAMVGASFIFILLDMG